MSNQNSTTKHKLRTKLILIYLIIFSFKLIKCNKEDDEKIAAFHFPEFDYKGTNKNELEYRDIESTCEQKESCEELINVLEKTKCIRMCISSSCYKEVYGFDELEEGEIDVRLNSFKGCFTQRLTKPSTI